MIHPLLKFGLEEHFELILANQPIRKGGNERGQNPKLLERKHNVK